MAETSKGGALSAGRLAALIAGPALALVLLSISGPEDMPPPAWRMVALVAWMVVWWLGEAVPVPATALLPIVLMPVLDLADLADTTQVYASPLIFLFLGGFLLAAAMERAGLHRRVALHIVHRVGSSPARIILGFMLATAFLSMWISNTATTIMMFAVALSIVEFVAQKTDDQVIVKNFGIALMLGIAYSASIGGVGTLIGTPPNAILASYLAETFDIHISFLTWMLFGLPVVVVMLPLAWLLLTRLLFPAHTIKIDDPRGVVAEELHGLGAMSRGEKLVGLVFLGAALGWILRAPLADLSGLPISDTAIAILAALVLFAVPVSRKRGEFALDWYAARDLPWGVLLLFGGGLALAKGFAETGLAEWIGLSVGDLEVSMLVLIALVTVAIVYMTEVTSNAATTATFLPILGAVAVGLAVDPRLLTIPVALSASMAFMMPVATPPNAIVFAYEQMKLSDMVRAGFWLNIIAIVVAFGAVTLLARPIFGI